MWNSAFMLCCHVLNLPALKDEILTASLLLSNARLYVSTVQIGRTPSKSNSSSNFWRFDNELNRKYVWLNSRMYIFQRCFQRDEWKNRYLFHIILGSPDTYLYDRHHVCPLYVWSAGCNTCTISDTSAWSTYIIRILVPTLRYT